MSLQNCPCGSGKLFKTCCEPYLIGQAKPDTPEALMRSRYTAFSLANIDYIAKTQTGPAAKGFDSDDSKLWAMRVSFTGLTIHNSSIDNHDPNLGNVHFTAHYRDGIQFSQIEEHSRFKRIKGAWFYVDRV